MVDKKTNELEDLSGLSIKEKEDYLKGVLSGIPDIFVLDKDNLYRYVSTLPADPDKRMECFKALAWLFSESENGPMVLDEVKMRELSPDVLKLCKAYNALLNSLFRIGADSSAVRRSVNECKYTDECGNVDYDFNRIPDEVKSRLFMRRGDGEFEAIFAGLLPDIPDEGLFGELVRVVYPVSIDPENAPDEYKDAYYRYLSLINEARELNKQMTEKAIADGFIKEAENEQK